MITKKLLRSVLILPGLLLSLQSHAQFNYTYTGGNGVSTGITDASFGGTTATCIVGAHTDFNSILLKKIDFNGGVFFDVKYSRPGSGVYVAPTKILHTANDQYIVVGFCGSNGNVLNPFAARFNSGGGLLWFYEYTSNTLPTGSGLYYSADVNICKVENDPSVPESYIIVAPGMDPARTTTSGGDIFVNALRINGNGTLMWNRKYIPGGTGVPPLGTASNDWRDFPESLVYVNASDGTQRYFIGGRSQKYGPGIWAEGGFFMGIDYNGNIVDDYQELPTSLHVNQEAIYDNASGEVVLTYGTGNVSAGIPNSASAIALTRIAAGPTLTLAGDDFYTSNGAIENYGCSIRKDATGTAYVISATLYDTVMYMGNIYKTFHPAILKVSRATRNPLAFKSFNRRREAWASGLISQVQGGIERYVIAATIESPYTTATNGMRVISADITADACGAEVEIPLQTTRVNTTKNYKLSVMNFSGQVNRPLQFSAQSGMTDCSLAPDPGIYKLAAPLTDLKVYPTLMQDAGILHIEAQLEESATLEAILCSIDGRMIRSIKETANKGSNQFRMDLPALAPGNYFLKVRSSNAAINQTISLTQK